MLKNWGAQLIHDEVGNVAYSFQAPLTFTTFLSLTYIYTAVV
jgi:hypothetical protein